MTPVDVLGRLSICSDDGHEVVVRGEASLVSVNLPNFRAGRSLAGPVGKRDRRVRALAHLHSALRSADVSLQVTVAGRIVALLTPTSRPTLLSRLAGLGPLDIRPLAVLLALLAPASQPS